MYGGNMDKLKEIVKLLDSKKKTISTMESCTGGCLVNEITNIEGASNVLEFSAVTYSNEYKIKMGVDKDIIEKYTVYSEETAVEMAKAIVKFTGSDYGIGITGKLNRVDENNLYGNDSEVFYTIFDKYNDKCYSYNIFVNKDKRKNNKNDVVVHIINSLYEILKIKK